MKPKSKSRAAWALACALMAGLAQQQAIAATFSGTTDVSNVPLATSSGSTVLPNLLFTLDASGSMGWNYLPDYVNDSGKCMVGTASFSVGFGGGSSTSACTRGLPPYDAGGQNGFNGVGYDPNVTYLPALNYDGSYRLSAEPLAISSFSSYAAVPNDAFGIQSTGTTNLTTGYPDYKFCNSAATPVCKRNGADNGSPTSLVSGTDSRGNTLSAGQFPYRTNPSNSSTVIFGLPEMMSQGSFTRSSSTVTVTTVESHGLAVNDTIYVTGTGTSGVDLNAVAVASVPSATTFTYTSTSSGTMAATGSYRKHAIGTWSRSSSTVTVTSNNHGLVVNDVIYAAPSSSFTVGTFTITAVTANTFSYSSSTGTGTPSGTWVRTGLYNNDNTSVNGPAISYWIMPIEYCSDRSLINCILANRATFSRSGNTVTVTSSSHGLSTGNLITVGNLSVTDMNVASTAVTVVNTNTFTYTTSNSGTSGSLTGSWGSASYSYPAYVRFCQTQAQSLAPGAVAGNDANGNPMCLSKYVNSGVMTKTYTYPRFGWFNRDTIQNVSGLTFSNRPGRTDCAAAPTCTYNEEIKNYARWWTYYQTRMQMMKTAAGRAFTPLVPKSSARPTLRVGFIIINPGSTISSSDYLKIDNFNATQASNWYNIFYSQNPANSTPLREAVSRAGWIFAGKLGTGLTAGIPTADDPVQASCQQNFNLMTTDGFWNGNAGQTLAGKAIGNYDNIDPSYILNSNVAHQPLVDRAATGTFDGGGATTSTVTPTSTINEQVVCIASNTTNFSSNASASPQQTACGCATGEHRIKQRSLITGNTVVTTEGVQTFSGTSTVTAFSDITGCVPAAVSTTTTTGQVVTRDMVCTRGSGGSAVTFADGQTVSCRSTGNSTDGVSGGTCASSTRVIIRQVDTQNVTSTSYDGGTPTVQTSVTARSYLYSTNTSNPPPDSSFSASFPGSCSSSTLYARYGSATVTTAGTSSTTSTAGTPVTITLSPNPATVLGGAPVTTTTPGGTGNTLADTALYYYMTPLRGQTDINGDATGPKFNLAGSGTVDLSGPDIPVRAGARDFMPYQHMVTFTVGLADGLMHYQQSYDSVTSGDFYGIKQKTVGGCFWTAGYCDWPAPAADDPSALDDLWHAAVNGRGSYYQAVNVNALTYGLQNALTTLNAQVAAAAASATSSPNVTQTDNQIFSTTYETATWSGKVFSQTIDPATGNVNSSHDWDADTLFFTPSGQTPVVGQVSTASDTRNIWMRDMGGSAAASKLKSFDYSVMNSTEQSWFSNKCSSLSQCTTLSTAAGSGLSASTSQVDDANNGTLLVGYLRGWQQAEGTSFRDRIVIDPITNQPSNTVLGDTISAKPSYVRNPVFSYTDTGYASFVTTNANRASRVYVGANDGYLHAFDAALPLSSSAGGQKSSTAGQEMWAYAPRFLMSGLYRLADRSYSNTTHAYFVDGSPETADVYDTTASAWKTILVGGAGGGGRGFYALDITDPNNPKSLWEFCSDSTLCGASTSDSDMGFAYGNPVIGKRAYDGKWVVVLTSGLNNVSPGSGYGYFYVLDAITGQVLSNSKVATNLASGSNAGSATTPSGLMKISAYYNSPLTDATFQYVYGGDQLGNVWRLDVGSATPTVMHIAGLLDGSGNAQPITTRPALTHIGSDRILYFATGRYLGQTDLTDHSSSGIAWQQSVYAFKDKNNDYGSNLRTDTNMKQQTLGGSVQTGRTISGSTVSWGTEDGWYVDFNPGNTTPGEEVNVDPRLVLGTLVVVTNIPTVSTNSCNVGGSSIEYNFDFKTGQAVSTAGGIVGRYLGGTVAVGMAIVQLPSGAIKDIVTGADTSKTTTAVSVRGVSTGVKRFSYRQR